MGRWAVWLACWMAAASPGWAQTVEVPAGLPPSDPAGQGLVEAFGLFCLQAFPEKGVAAAAPGRVVEMPAREVKAYLHDDPGRGWTYHGPDGDYVLTVEEPPYHTCAVRREYARLPGYQLPWFLSTGLWAASHGRPAFEAAPSQTFRRNGLVIVAQGRVLPGPERDIFFTMETTYPDGHVEARLARRAFGR